MAPRFADEDRISDGKFLVSFNGNGDFFSNLFDGIEVVPGYETVVTVTPVNHVVTEDFSDLAPEQRKCKFGHERNAAGKSYFNGYTQKSCEMECAAKYLQSRFQCIPWDVWPYDFKEQRWPNI